VTLTADVMASVDAAKRNEARAAARIIAIGEEMERERVKREARRQLDAEDRGPVSLPEILTLRERLERPRAVTNYRISNWQPCGTRVMLAAGFKAGKTTMIGNLIRSLIDGDAWLDRDAVVPIAGTVVLLDFEMSATQLDEWLRVQGIRGDDRVVVMPLRGHAAAFAILDRENREQWAARLRQHGATYLVLDCLRPVLDALGLDEHRDAGRFLVAFDALLREAGISEALIVQHMGHLGERARGDSRLRDWPDVEWRLVRQDDDPASPRFLSAYGRDVNVTESQLTYDRQTRRLALAGGSRKDARTELVLEAVLGLLAGAAPMSGRKVKAALAESDHSRDAIEAALRLGQRDGRLIVESGPNRSTLYRVSGSVRSVSGGHPTERVSGCPPPSIEGGHRDTPRRLPLHTSQAVSDPDTGDADVSRV